MLPKEFYIKPNINTILPKESIIVDVFYESKDNYVGHREGDIVNNYNKY